MKDGLRFVDCDMHIMEPIDLFDKYLDKKFRDRVVLPVDVAHGCCLLMKPVNYLLLKIPLTQKFRRDDGLLPKWWNW